MAQLKSGTRLFPRGKTNHIVGGVAVRDIASLKIVQVHNDPGYYLLYLNADGQEITDTWHLSLEDAFLQADYEFGLGRSDWQLTRSTG